MNMKNKIALIVLVLFLAGGVSYYIYNDLQKISDTDNIGSSISNIVSDISGIDNNEETTDFVGVEVSTTTVFIEDQGKKISIPVPDLDRTIIFKEGTSESVKENARKNIEATVMILKQNNDFFDSWINLGLYRKSIGDYKGARDAWEYAGAIRPKNSISFGNLGHLYAYYLKDNIKAENNFLITIENDKNLSYLYYQVYEFYNDILNNEIKTREILQKAIVNLGVSEAQNFQELLDSL